MNRSTLIVIVSLLYAIPCQSAEPNLRLWNSQKDNYGIIAKTPTNFDMTANVVVVIPEVSDNIGSAYYKVFAKRITKIEPKTIILAIDWSGMQKGKTEKERQILQDNSANIRKVADWAFQKIFNTNGLSVKCDQTHIIGFGHGSHAASLIGEQTKGQLRHITLLDPITNETNLADWSRLFKDNRDARQFARFVDVYMTSMWGKTFHVHGDKNFFIMWENLAFFDVWNFDHRTIANQHRYAFRWYLSTIGSKHTDFGYAIAIPEKREIINGPYARSIISTLSWGGHLRDMDKPIKNELTEGSIVNAF